MGAVALDAAKSGLCNTSSVRVEGEVLDLAHLSRYTLGDEDLQKEILDLFAAQIASSLERLQKAADADDNGAWQMAAHTLKGSARGVGAFRLGSAAEAGEELGDSSDGRTAALQAIKSAAEETRAAISG